MAVRGPGGSVAAAKSNEKNKDTSKSNASSGDRGVSGDRPSAAKQTVGSGSFTSGTDSEGTQHQRQDSTPQNGGVGTGHEGSGTPERVANYAKAVDDFNNVGNSTMDNFWNGVANFFGIREENPMTADPEDPNGPLNTGNDDWGANTAGILGGLAGGALIPGLGLLTGPVAGAINDELGRPIPDINLGQLNSTPNSTPGSEGISASDIQNGEDDTSSNVAENDTNTDRNGQGDQPAETDPSGATQAAPVVKPKAPEIDEGGADTILPQTGIGITIPTQTAGEGSSVYVGTPDQRRRRGSLGGLGKSGLAL